MQQLLGRRFIVRPLAAYIIFQLANGGGGLNSTISLAAPSDVQSVRLPDRPPAEFHLIAKLGPGPARENSGIVKSRQFDDVFWMHNDSGDEPRIYPIHRDGTNYDDTRYAGENGVLIGGAINVDWEDITVDSNGHVIIADVGNNENDRRDLALYYLEEPAPTAGRTTFLKKLFVRYPDQGDFPAKPNQFNFDCEAVFTVGDTVYLLTKNRSDSFTSLYVLENPQTDKPNVLRRLGTFDIQGQAVGADCTPDGKRLVVLTYTAIWLFERDNSDQSFFDGRISWAPSEEHDAEAICFADDSTLLIADEAQAELFELPIAELIRVR